MLFKEAIQAYGKLNLIVTKRSTSPDNIRCIEGMTIVREMQPCLETIPNTEFERTLDKRFGKGQNDSSDDNCVVTYKGIFAMIWEHAGQLFIGAPFGFYDNTGKLIICYANTNKKFEVLA